MTTPDKIALATLPRELAAFTGQPAPDYRTVYNRTLSGKFPAEQINGRWHVRRSDLPAVAAALGFEAKATEAPASKPRRSSARPGRSAPAAHDA